MKRVYDMSTGRLVEASRSALEADHRHDPDATALALQLQPVTSEPLPKRKMPPELAVADLNALLDKLG